MDNIALIGLGNIGLRHAQALKNLVGEYNFWFLDPSIEARENIKKEFADWNQQTVHYCSSIGELPKKIDLAIVATSSVVRKEVVKELYDSVEVSNLILEKILFPRIADYQEMKELFMKKETKVWVNCPRRMYPSYKKIKEMLKNESQIRLAVSGGKHWELGSNAIHMIDLVSFLAGNTNAALRVNFDNEVYESKREGYKEISGVIEGKMGRCSLFTITADRNEDTPLCIYIDCNKIKILINENEHNIFVSDESSEWKMNHYYDEFPFQSQLTNMAAYDILSKGICELPKFDEASREHILYLEPVIKYFNDHGMESDLCPIT